MSITFIITAVLFIIASSIIFKLVKSLVKAILLVSLLFTVITAVFGFFVYQDAMDIKENFDSAPKLFLLQKEGVMVTGFVMKDPEKEQFDFLEKEQLTEMQSDFKKNNLKAVLGNNWKAFIIDYDSFFASIETVKFVSGGEEKTIAKKTIVDAMEAADPRDVILREVYNVPEENIEDSKAAMGSSEEFRAKLFLMSFGSINEKEGLLFVFKGYKEDNIIIYPETAVFRLIKIVPLSKMKGFIKKGAQETEKKIREKLDEKTS